MRSLLLLLALSQWVTACHGQQRLSDEQKTQLSDLGRKLAAAMKDKDEKEVRRLAARATTVLGEQAGVPETAEVYRPAPKDGKPLTAAEVQVGFDAYLKRLPKYKWWKIGQDPTKTPHLPREVAAVILGCVAVTRAGLDGAKECLAEARTAGDYLLWTQERAGTGVIPFPAVRNGEGKVFGIAERFLARAEKAGQLDKVVTNGWAFEDADGGLQFDNGECGVALLELYEATRDKKYLAAAQKAADWAITRPCVPNWNYNSFSIHLLAATYRVTKEEKYLRAAKEKVRIGLLPGQLQEGKHKGRWLDGHNALAAYHYIMVRSLVELVGVLDARDADRPAALAALRLALLARNGEFAQQGIVSKDKSLEALLLIRRRMPEQGKEVADCAVAEAMAVLGREVVAQHRRGGFPLAPSTWGQYLENAK